MLAKILFRARLEGYIFLIKRCAHLSFSVCISVFLLENRDCQRYRRDWKWFMLLNFSLAMFITKVAFSSQFVGYSNNLLCSNLTRRLETWL